MTHMIAAPNGVHRAVYELHTYMYVQKCTGCCTDDKSCMYRLQLFKLRWFRHPLDEVMREKSRQKWFKLTKTFFRG